MTMDDEAKQLLREIRDLHRESLALNRENIDRVKTMTQEAVDRTEHARRQALGGIFLAIVLVAVLVACVVLVAT